MNSNDCESAKLLFCENKNLEIFADNIMPKIQVIRLK